MAGQPTTEILDGLRELERKTSLVFTLLKASVYSIVLQQEIDWGNNNPHQGHEDSWTKQLRYSVFHFPLTVSQSVSLASLYWEREKAERKRKRSERTKYILYFGFPTTRCLSYYYSRFAASGWGKGCYVRTEFTWATYWGDTTFVVTEKKGVLTAHAFFIRNRPRIASVSLAGINIVWPRRFWGVKREGGMSMTPLREMCKEKKKGNPKKEKSKYWKRKKEEIRRATND
jgi:hypothetical protein